MRPELEIIQSDPDAPRTLHIVLNNVVADSRVLKCAWSLGNAGWNVRLIGASATTENDELAIGYARISRVGLKIVVPQVQLAFVLRKLRALKRKAERYVNRIIRNYRPPLPNYQRATSLLLPIAMDFKPAIIHAHDYTALPIAGFLVERLRGAGLACELIYDAHEYVPGVAHLNEPLRKVYTKNERKYSAIAASILSVSEGMNELLIPHLQINSQPEIVANDPLVEGQQPSKRNLRNDCQIGAEVPLIVYSGAVAPQRGIATMVEGLRAMPEVHGVLIANPENASVKKFVAEAADIADRFHVVPYVPNGELVDYLSSGDIGLIPIHHKLNHEISLITKFGEYMQARLPIVVSDVRTMAAEVRKLGNGEVHIAEDTGDFVRAVRMVLADKAKYQAAYTPEVLSERSWERQAENLVRIYNEVANVNPRPRSHLPFVVNGPF